MQNDESNKQRYLSEVRTTDNETLGKYLVAARSENYAHPSINFPRIAKVWEGITGRPYSSYEIGLMLLGIKLARLVNGFHEDSLDDIEGYAQCLRELENG